MKVGTLCSGYEGFGLALGFEPSWVCEYEAAPSAVLAHHHPDAPNLGDLTAVDWSSVEPVDLICAGYPCQPFSHAGKREGTNDARHLWPYIGAAVRVLRPRHVFLENVAGHLSMGFGDVLGDLAEAGYDARWCSVRASDVGAPHRRERVFILATDRDDRGRGDISDDGSREPDVAGRDRGDAAERRGAPPATDTRSAGAGRDGGAVSRAAEESGRPRADVHAARDARGVAAADADDAGRSEHGRGLAVGTEHAAAQCLGESPADAERIGQRPWAGLCEGGQDGVGRGRPGDDYRPRDEVETSWGAYEPAIRRWEALTRPAPAPTDDKGRLSPRFVEWMMGLPDGWVCDVPDLPRTAQLKMLGNGIVPQQARAAWELLTARTMERAA